MEAGYGSAENTFSKSPLNAPAKPDASAEAIPPEKGIWKSRTPLEKYLIATVLLLSLVTAILLSAIILLVVLDTDESMASENGKQVCSTPGCETATESGAKISIHNGAQNYDGRGDSSKKSSPGSQNYDSSGDSSKKSSPGRPTKDPTFTDTVSSQSSYSSGTLQTNPQNSEVCSTQGCKSAADYILNAINTSVNPCENFFEFACGQWIEKHPIADDELYNTPLTHATKIVRQQMQVLLEEDVVSESKAINMVRAMYCSCMNETQLEEQKSWPLLKSLTELGEWPLLQGKWDKTKFNLTYLLIKARRDNGVNPFFSPTMSIDSDNATRYLLAIDQTPALLGARDFYLNSTLYSGKMAGYRTFFKNVFKLLKTDGNFNRSEAEMNVDIDKIIDFETAIAKIMASQEERANITRSLNKREIRDLYSLAPQINWLSYYQSIVPADVALSLHNGSRIVIKEIEYIRHVFDLIEKTDVRIIADYILWLIVFPYTDIMDKRYSDLHKQWTGSLTSPPRKNYCYGILSQHLPLPLSAIYVQAHFKQIDKEEATRMVASLENVFVDMFQTNVWMDEATKAAAIEKAISMAKYVGYSNITMNFTQLDQKFSMLSFNESDTYFSIMRKLASWLMIDDFNKFLKPIDKRDYEMNSVIANAFYQPELNTLNLPAAVLQPPFFSGSFPKAVNYGDIGSIMGHEVIHGFDNTGSKYDKDANLRNWWSNASLKEYNVRTRCIQEQYGNYTVPLTGDKVNGMMTLGENIADNGGIKGAFKAYQKYVQDNGEEPRLPGLQQYTNEQIFFISYAHFHCGNATEIGRARLALLDNHSPFVYRVNGVVSNMEAFANTFKCPPNSPLNPKNRCSVW